MLPGVQGEASLMRPGDRRQAVRRAQGLGGPRRGSGRESAVREGRSAYLCSLFVLPATTTSRRSPGKPPRSLIRRPFGEDSVSASPMETAVSHLFPLLSFLLPPPQPLCGDTTYLSLVPPRLKYKTLILEVFLRRQPGHGWRGNA